MAAGDVAAMASFEGVADPECSATDNTNVYYGLNNGDVYREVISTKALTKLATLPGRVMSMAYYSNTLYCGIAGGKTFSVATA